VLRATPLPPPYGGERYDLPLAVIQSPYCERAQNWVLEDGVARFRKGDLLWKTPSATGSNFPLNLATYGAFPNEKMFLCFDDSGLKWVDITASGAGTTVHTVIGGGDDEIHTLFFNNYLMYFGEFSLTPASTGPQYYNGSAWGTLAYTGWTGDVPFGGAVYKNRAYLINKGTATFSYSGIQAISGALTKVDLSQIISKKANLYAIASVSLSEGIQQENVLAFIFSSGEVLVYRGTYPNAADWSIIGRFQIPRPIYYNSTIDVLGDTYIITESALVSLRTLFQRGQAFALTDAPSASIAQRWKTIFSQFFNSYGLKGVYDDVQNRIIILLPGNVDYTGSKQTIGARRLIYSLDNGAWFEHYRDSLEVGYSATMFNGDFYYGQALDAVVIKAEGRTDFVDQNADGSTSGMTTFLRTAPLPTDKFGVSRITGIELINQTDAHLDMAYSLISNLGQRTSALQALPDQGVGVGNPMINVGIDGNYIQLDMTCQTRAAMTVGYTLYAMNIWSEQGGVR